MSTGYILFIILFVSVISVFAYLDTRKGVRASLPKFLKIFVPMLLAGIIVKIPELLKVTKKVGFSAETDVAPYIIGGIGTIIFFTVLFNAFKTEESYRKLKIYEYFLGFVTGIFRGWLYFGFFTIYMHKIFGFISIKPELLKIIENPVKWVVFLSFIGK